MGHSWSRLFHFKLMWLEVPGFLDKIKGWWEDCIVEGSASFRFAQNLKLLKTGISKWKKEEFGGIESRKMNCSHKLKELEKKEMTGGLEISERNEKMMVQDEF